MKWTLVTGGGRRLGGEICKTLAKNGYSILVHYRESESEAETVVQACRDCGVKAEMFQADFSSMEGVGLLIEKIRKNGYRIENLINNVGNFSELSTLNTPVELWLNLFQTNLHAPFALISELIASIKSYQGSIINIGTAGVMDIRADRKCNAYMLTKRSLYALTKSLAKELARDGVRVNMISPGILMNSVSIPSDLESFGLARTGELEEVCRVLLFLLNKESEYITGQNIEVSGGYAL